MSLLSWFSKKPARKKSTIQESSGLGHVDATVPYSSGKTRGPVAHATAPGSAANRKGERLERREMLYAVVREAMIKAGVLSASYKFKVLSLDSRGRQYLIMMDIARQYAGEATRLAEIEALVAQHAKARYDIVVTAVYWRVNEHVTAGLTRATGGAATASKAEATAPAVDASRDKRAPGGFEPLDPKEVVAFKEALANVAHRTPLSAPGEIVHSGPRNPTPPQFEDTELDDRPYPLSGTQYGDLN